MNNNNEQFDKFIRDFDSVRMSANEKNEMRKNLETFAYNNNTILHTSPYFTYIRMSFFKKSLAMALIFLLFISASKPASAGALPGELLYNVKIIHEKIESASIKKPEKKVVFEIKQAETRIQEAVALAETNKLDTKKQQKLAKDIKKSVEGVSEKIDEIKQDNPEKALSLNSDLKTTLKVNSDALKEVTKKKKDILDEEEIVEKIPTKTNLLEEVSNDEDENIEKTIVNKDEPSQEPEVTKIIEEDVEETNPETETENQIPEEGAEINEEYESFADIILDSIEDDIEKTEIAQEIIEEEITLEEESNIAEPIPEEIALDVSDSLIEELKVDAVDLDEPKLVQENEEVILTDIVVAIENEVISEDIKSEITSLEHILEAEEKLNALLEELSLARDPENLEKIQALIEEKLLGQAFIEIQNEIEFLYEIKLSLGIESDLGISMETEPNSE